MFSLAQVNEIHMNKLRNIDHPKWLRLILILVVFQICFILLQRSFDYLVDLIFTFNYSIGNNRWNSWILDYQSSSNFINSFWGTISADFYSLILSIYISLAFINFTDRAWGWRVLLIYRLATKAIFIALALIFSEQSFLITAGNGMLVTFLELIPFGIYKLEKL